MKAGDYVQRLKFIAGKRKYLFCTDQQGYSFMLPIMEEAFQHNIPFELVYLGDMSREVGASTDLVQWLSQQKMGSYLYFAGGWDKLYEVKRFAEEIGYSSEEAQYMGIGQRMIRVFCCRCHGINECEDHIEVIHCSHCDLSLAVTDHYSPIRNAYLGFVAKL